MLIVPVLAPYFLVAPLLFAEERSARISLGTLMQTSNSFDKVFGSLSILSNNWGGINEWRSTLVRLRQFEHEQLAAPALAGTLGSGMRAPLAPVASDSETELSPMCASPSVDDDQRGPCKDPHGSRRKGCRYTS